MITDQSHPLLWPRYQVSNLFPDCPFEKDQIIELRHYRPSNRFTIHEHGEPPIVWTSDFLLMKDGSKISYHQQYFTDFPGVFREVKWWEFRQPEQFPEYLIHKHLTKRQVLRVLEWKTGIRNIYCVCEGIISHLYPHNGSLTPATEQEYIDYLKTQTDAQTS